MNKPELIFNLSFPKTGTTSIEESLMLLDYNIANGIWKSPHSNYLYGQYVNDDIDELIYFVNNSIFNAFSDGPWFSPKLYEMLYQEFPHAKYILCIRDSEEWFASLSSMIIKRHKAAVYDISPLYTNQSYGFYRWFKKVLGENLVDKQHIIDIYEQHNKDVVEFFQNTKSLLVMQTEKLDWSPLLRFLNKDKPPFSFPKLNARRKNT